MVFPGAAGDSNGTQHMARRTAAANQDVKRVRVRLVKSTIGFNKEQAKVVEGMGLRRLGHTVELPDTDATRGMIHKVRHLVVVE
jgi:large subunit ribosomal protein L30